MVYFGGHIRRYTFGGAMCQSVFVLLSIYRGIFIDIYMPEYVERELQPVSHFPKSAPTRG